MAWGHGFLRQTVLCNKGPRIWYLAQTLQDVNNMSCPKTDITAEKPTRKIFPESQNKLGPKPPKILKNPDVPPEPPALQPLLVP